MSKRDPSSPSTDVPRQYQPYPDSQPPRYDSPQPVGSQPANYSADGKSTPQPPGYAQQPLPYPPPQLYQPQQGQPIINQPIGQVIVQGNFINNATPTPLNCPPGLEYLSAVDQLLVHQQVELFEAFTGFETKNKFRVKNSLGQDVYYAVEDSDCLVRNCCGPIRPFGMKILDNFKHEVIHLYRPLACQTCCFPCCLQSMEVSSPPGTIIGTVKQEWSIFYPTFAVKNANGETECRIEGPFFTCSCCCNDVKFRVTSADGTRDIGKITKQWSGLLREAFTDADHFGVSFPIDLDVKMKAVLLGALFLIDAMFFETDN